MKGLSFNGLSSYTNVTPGDVGFKKKKREKKELHCLSLKTQTSVLLLKANR